MDAGVVVGIVSGVLLRMADLSPEQIDVLGFLGELMLRLLKMLVLPLVAGSMVAGMHVESSALLCCQHWKQPTMPGHDCLVHLNSSRRVSLHRAELGVSACFRCVRLEGVSVRHGKGGEAHPGLLHPLHRCSCGAGHRAGDGDPARAGLAPQRRLCHLLPHP